MTLTYLLDALDAGQPVAVALAASLAAAAGVVAAAALDSLTHRA